MRKLPTGWANSSLSRSKTVITCVVLAAGISRAQTPVVTWHYDNSRSGANTTEVSLTPANVNVNNFGKLFTQPVDGIIIGHPLYLPGVSIPGVGVHNVAYVATMNDTVYAFDVNTGNIPALWTTSLLSYSPPGATPVPIAVKGCETISWTQTGVISTPVIDPVANVIYLMAETYENKQVVHRLHALDVATGVEESGWPVTVAATYNYNGADYTFVDTHQMNRPGLLLSNGYVYAGFGSPGCNGSDQGWVMAFNTTTGQLDSFDLEPGSRFGSVWQKGAGLSADSDGYVYADTGEGGMVSGVDLAITVFKLNAADGGQMSLADWFTPWNWHYLSNNDLDINNAVVILPDQGGPVPHEAITLGKEGTIYVLNRDNMGQFCATCVGGDPQIVQEVQVVAKQGYSPVVWNSLVYITGSGKIQIYSLNNGLLTLEQSVAVGNTTNPVVTANGTTNGILWFVDGNTLEARNAENLVKLYASSQAPGGRDTLPAYAHFASPVVADGKLFFGTLNSLVVYGLFPPMSIAAGNQQSATVATTLPTALEVQAIDSTTGAGVSALTVTFSDGKGGGILGSPTAVTDSNGFASTTFTLPTKAGTYSVTAITAGFATTTFTETAIPSTATALSILSGNKQTTTVGTALPNPLVVKVHDAYSNGISGVSVSFTDDGAGGTFSANPVTTNSAGEVSVTYTAGATPGNVSIRTSSTGLHTLIFSETVGAGSTASTNF